MPPDDKNLEARITILEYRQDQGEAGLVALRNDYTEEHTALRKSLQGIEKNLQAIKWVAVGGAGAFLAQLVGIERALQIISTYFI